MRFTCALAALVVAFSLCSKRPAQAESSSAALAAIADAADRICGIVADKGESGSKNAELEIHAELNGLAKRLANVGGSGSGQITSNEYQGLLQKDLPTTMQGARECKLQVLKMLQSTLIPGTIQSTGPGAPSSDLLQAPSNAQTIDSIKIGNSFGLDLYSCNNEPNGIICYVVFSRLASGSDDYNSNNMTVKTRIVDNFHEQHRLRKGFFIDGLGNHPLATNLAQGDSIWLALEFEVGPRPISSARLIFDSLSYSPQLRGPVN